MADATLARSLRATLEYFDLFDYPLTLVELARYRYAFPGEAAAAPSLGEVAAALETVGAGERGGFHFLPGREEIIALRERRFRGSERDYRKAHRVARVMAWLPSVRMVAVCNSLALANGGPDSDIDLFVVVSPGALWITRLLVVGILDILRMRPTSRSRAGKICLCFFLSEADMNLSRVALQPEDTYFRYWIASLVPLVEKGGAMAAFLAVNSWVAERLPSAMVARRRVPAPGTMSGGSFLLRIMKAAEVAAKSVQMKRLPAAIRAAAAHGNDVVLNDDMIKLHVTDRRAHYEDLFRQRVSRMPSL